MCVCVHATQLHGSRTLDLDPLSLCNLEVSAVPRECCAKPRAFLFSSEPPGEQLAGKSPGLVERGDSCLAQLPGLIAPWWAREAAFRGLAPPGSEVSEADARAAAGLQEDAVTFPCPPRAKEAEGGMGGAASLCLVLTGLVIQGQEKGLPGAVEQAGAGALGSNTGSAGHCLGHLPSG
ncbi:unnamed protein product [Eretmochelys imbricata]